MLRERLINLVVCELRSRDFHGRSDSSVEPDAHYHAQAERDINAMSNLEFVDLLDEALAMGVVFGQGTLVP